MKKRKISEKFICFILAFAMVISLAVPGLGPVQTKAEEISEATVDFEDPFAKMSFYDLKEEGILQVSEGISTKDYVNSYITTIRGEIIDLETPDKGIILSAKADQVADAQVSFTKTFDFGENKVDRLCINALAQRASVTKFKIICDNQATTNNQATENNQATVPTIKLYNQTRSDNWSKSKEINVDVSDCNFTGKCTITFQFATNKTDDGENEKLEVLLRSMQFIPESIPVVTLDIDELRGSIADMNNDPRHNTECYGSMSIRVPESYDNPYGAQYTGGTYEMDSICGRGNFIWSEENKKSYNIKLEKNSDLLGMGENKEWVLFANSFDNTLVRNRLTYQLAEELGLECAPHCINVDVIMNGEYLGDYLLCEQVTVDKNSENLEDLTKAYEKLEEAIYGDDFKNSDGESYADLMDVDSSIAYFWLQELSLNRDSSNTPDTYLYKKADKKDESGNVIEPGKLYWGPLEDFGCESYGNSGSSYEGFRFQKKWFVRLMDDPEYVDKAVACWNDIVKPALQDAVKEGGLLDQYEAELTRSVKDNYDKWDYFEVTEADYDCERDELYSMEMNRFKEWIVNRIDWIDDHLESIVPQKVKVIFKNGEDILLETQGFVGKAIEQFPEETPSQGEDLFTGWVCYSTYMEDGETYTEECSVDEDYRIEASALNEKGELIVQAQFLLKEDITSIDQVIFEHKKYCTYYENEEDASSFFINYIYLPEDAMQTDLQWESLDESVAIVEGGYVTSRGQGETTICATTPNGKTYSVPVLVLSHDEFNKLKSSGYSISDKKITLNPGKSKKLYLGIQPDFHVCLDQIDLTYQWFSTNEDVAMVSEHGYVTAISPGKAEIIAVDTQSGKYLTCSVTVEEKKVDPVKPSTSIKVGTKFTSGNLKYSVTACKGKDLQVQVIGKVKSKKTITIPSTVTYKKKKFKVTAIKASVFAKNKTITTLSIGKYVKKIGSKAFYKCKNLKKVKISSKVLKSVGKQAFSGIYKKAKISVPKGMKKKYKKFFKKLNVK